MDEDIRVIGRKAAVARKEYDDDAYWWVDAWIDNGMQYVNDKTKMSFGEKRVLVKMLKDRPDKIKKGELYIEQRQVMGNGRFWTYRAKPFLHNLCIKQKLFDIG